MKMYKLLGATPLALLAACGGGGGVSSTPRPPEEPISPSYSSFTALVSDQQLAMTGSTQETIYPPSGPKTTTSVFSPYNTSIDRTVAISYDAATQSYTIHDGSRSQEFGPDDVVTDQQYLGTAYTVHARGLDSDLREYFAIFNPAGDTTHVALTYTTVVNWIQSRLTQDASGSYTHTYKSLYAVGGFKTLASDMPRTGTAVYNGFVEGSVAYAEDVPGNRVTGSSRLTVDFAPGRLEAKVFLNDIVKNNSVSTIVVSGTGAIGPVPARFSGQFDAAGYKGPFDGAFFGPRAAEMGFSFSLRGSDGSKVDGVAAGRR